MIEILEQASADELAGPRRARRAIARAGFVSRHRILKVGFRGDPSP